VEGHAVPQTSQSSHLPHTAPPTDAAAAVPGARPRLFALVRVRDATRFAQVCDDASVLPATAVQPQQALDVGMSLHMCVCVGGGVGVHI